MPAASLPPEAIERLTRTWAAILQREHLGVSPIEVLVVKAERVAAEVQDDAAREV